ncbi:MAG: aconitate hydratase [Candidatus Thorarchaeota archaeon]|nr:MAG: aconitate hydratase [Candidatus Thorarchaeota archaeon]
MTSVARKILSEHIMSGSASLRPGDEIGLKIDRTLTQDATGTLAYLQFEAIGLEKVRTELSVSFVDHNTLQTDFRNPDDHRYLQTVAAKYGILFSRPGNGICHQVFLERFSKPGETLIGSDSHTPTAGGAGMIAIGAGGLDVAVAMGGGAYYLKTPEIVGVKLYGRMPDYVSAKDVILEVLRRLKVDGGVDKILEYFGPGIKQLSVPERATITNMGAETGATTSVFPSDEITREFLKMQQRAHDWVEIPEANEKDFDEVITIDLSKLEPFIAKPHSPDNVVPLSELIGLKVDQVAIGSCTNSSLKDMLTVAALLKGRKIHPNTVLGVSPGSRQVLEYIAENGQLADMISAGARILESACGPCIGMGFAPPSTGVSLRTFNRNFKGRSGTADAQVYLVSPEVAVAAAIYGEITDPRKLGPPPRVEMPLKINVDDSMIIRPSNTPSSVEIIRGPNIVQLPKMVPLPDSLPAMQVLIKLGDDITTDQIMPAGAKILPLRSNLPEISMHVFEQVDPSFVSTALRAKEQGGGIILAGNNYGQGSSREHAALAPMYLGVKLVLAKSFARIHKANLVNFGILPCTIDDPTLFEKIDPGDTLEMKRIRQALKEGRTHLSLTNKAKGIKIPMTCELTEREKNIILAGGLLNYTREGGI